MARLTTSIPLSLLAISSFAAPALAQGSTAANRAEAEASGSDDWSITPRGRIQIDIADVGVPGGVTGDGFGTEGEIRRAYLGVDGKLTGGFGFRAEVDLAGGDVTPTDVYLTYEPSDSLTFTLGHQKPFFGLEEQTSDLFTSMLERAAFTSAFGFERRVGFSGVYSGDGLVVQAGAFTVNSSDLDDDAGSYGFDARVVLSPRLGPGFLHVAGSAHLRELSDDASTVRYRARPFSHTADTRLIDTGTILATGERSFGAELAYVAGPFHATAEGHRITALRPGLQNPSFQGGYVEVGMLITPGDTTAYKDGVYDRIRPVRPITEGGIGAIQVNLRYDRLDLNDGPIIGGQQETLGLGVIWVPVSSARLQANYGRLWISDAAVLNGAVADYSVNTVGVRAQFDF